MSAPPNVPLDRVESELGKLWEAAGKRTPTRTMTVIALCETPAHVPTAEQAIAHAAPRHGARSIIVDWDERGTGVDAGVSLFKDCAERIRLSVHTRSFVPDAVSRLLAPDLPVVVWWVGDLPDHEVLLDRVTAVGRASVAVLDANVMDLRDLAVIDALARRSDRVAIADFCWHRLRAWQEMMARFFDGDEAVEDLQKPHSLRIEFQQRERDPEPSSNQATLFASWLRTRLQHDFAIEYVPVRREGLVSGSLVDVVLRAGEGTYRVHRAPGEPSVICWEGERPSVPFPNQCVRTTIPDDGTLLARVLARPLRDPLYEASLATAARGLS